MLERRRTRLTREGWYYLFVTGFVIGGAVLREVNLLVVLAGMMLGLLFFNWRLAKVVLRSLSVRRYIPARVSAGDIVVVEVTAENDRRGLPAWNILLHDRLVYQLTAGETAATSAEVLIPYVRTRGTVNTSYRVRLPRRGKYLFGPFELSTTFPLGLMRVGVNSHSIKSVIAYPRLGRLSREWFRMIQGLQAGSQITQRRGQTEGDYYGLRDWRNGDSRRWIHWRTSAKRGTLSVLQFEQPRNRDLVLIVDVWLPTEPTDRQRAAVEQVISFAATAIIDSCRRGGRLVFVCAGKESRKWSSPATTRLSQELLDYLSTAEASNAPQISQAIREVQARSHSGQQIVVASTRNPPQDVAHFSAAGHASPLWIDVTTELLQRYFQI